MNSLTTNFAKYKQTKISLPNLFFLSVKIPWIYSGRPLEQTLRGPKKRKICTDKRLKW